MRSGVATVRSDAATVRSGTATLRSGAARVSVQPTLWAYAVGARLAAAAAACLGGCCNLWWHTAQRNRSVSIAQQHLLSNADSERSLLSSAYT